jgi:hypothetical protein
MASTSSFRVVPPGVDPFAHRGAAHDVRLGGALALELQVVVALPWHVDPDDNVTPTLPYRLLELLFARVFRFASDAATEIIFDYAIDPVKFGGVADLLLTQGGLSFSVDDTLATLCLKIEDAVLRVDPASPELVVSFSDLHALQAIGRPFGAALGWAQRLAFGMLTVGGGGPATPYAELVFVMANRFMAGRGVVAGDTVACLETIFPLAVEFYPTLGSMGHVVKARMCAHWFASVLWEPALRFYSLVPEEMYADLMLRASYASGTALQRELVLEARYTVWARTLLNLTAVLGDVAVGGMFQLYKRLLVALVPSALASEIASAVRLDSALASWVHLVAAMGSASTPAERVAIIEARRERDNLAAPASGESRSGEGGAAGVIPRGHNRVKIAQILRSGEFLALARRIHAASQGSHQALPGAQDESLEGVTIDPLVLLGLCMRSQIMPLVQFIFSKSLDISMHEIFGLLLPARPSLPVYLFRALCLRTDGTCPVRALGARLDDAALAAIKSGSFASLDLENLTPRVLSLTRDGIEPPTSIPERERFFNYERNERLRAAGSRLFVAVGYEEVGESSFSSVVERAMTHVELSSSSLRTESVRQAAEYVTSALRSAGERFLSALNGGPAASYPVFALPSDPAKHMLEAVREAHRGMESLQFAFPGAVEALLAASARSASGAARSPATNTDEGGSRKKKAKKDHVVDAGEPAPGSLFGPGRFCTMVEGVSCTFNKKGFTNNERTPGSTYLIKPLCAKFGVGADEICWPFALCLGGPAMRLAVCPDCAAHATNTAPHVHSAISKIRRVIQDKGQVPKFLST